MMRPKVYLRRVVVLLLLIAGSALLAQTGAPVSAQQPATVQGTFQGVLTVERADLSPPLRELATRKTIPQTELPPNDLPTGLEGPLGPQDVDGAVQSTVGTGGIPAPIVSFNGPPNISGVSPPDPVGDVGPNHYVAMSNLSYQIFTKTGTSLVGPSPNNTLWAGFGGACQTENSGDPIVVHDQFTDRWVLMQFTSAGPTYFLCMAASQTADPTGAYYRYAISTGSNFPDYPKMSVWTDAILLTSRNFAGASFSGIGVFAVNKAQLYAGNPAPTTVSLIVAPGSTPYNVGGGLLPSDIDGNALPPAGNPAYLMGSMDDGGPFGAPQDALTLWKFAYNFANPAASTVTLANTLPIAAYDTMMGTCSANRQCVPQPGTTNRIDHLGYRQRPLYRLAYRNYGTHESLVTNTPVEAGSFNNQPMAGTRWWEVRSPNSSPVVYQEGTFAPGLTDGIHRWMGSIAMDAVGNMALGYSASAATTTFPSVWYTGRLAGDPLGQMPQGEGSIINGTGSQTGSARWGDYTSMNVDPADDCTFWYVNEYLPTTSSVGWQLRIGAFKFPNCTTGPTMTPTPTVTGTPPTSTPTNTPIPTNTPTLTPTPVGPGCGGAIEIPAVGGTVGTGVPYPSTANVSGLGTSATDVNLLLNGLSHTYPDDIDILLVAPDGTTNAIVMSDAGGGNDVVNVNLVLDDEAAAPLPDSAQITSGSYQPANYGTGDPFPAPAPAPSANVALSSFDGLDPNGTWSLYIVDDASGDSGALVSWCLQITTTGATPTATATPVVSPTATVVTSIELGDLTGATGGTPYVGWLLSVAGLALVAVGLISRRRR